MSRKKIVAGNWKMNLDYQAGISLFSEITQMLKDEHRGNQEVIVCAPFIHLGALNKLNDVKEKLGVGAQNLHQADSGAYTGEISGSQIKSVGGKYVLIGHSERRSYFKETNEILAEKVDAAFRHHLTPIFCIGETKEQREDGSYFEVLKAQLEQSVFHLSSKDFERVIIAYEPVWAIGTGLTASPEQAQEVHAYIRKVIAEKYSQELADSISILYGGSCNPKNAESLFAQADIDGGLIGGASLKSRDFLDIVKVYNS
ncbi:MAG TPA: triose-phosphate isomerase [Candidatus Sphingobacterium stercoripullorum]|uniref:Triosephosphate isomerase n=1 Tax=Candidatus Sphingobacterium stercoripullorum TaxID=2838759 RepID=A0A9D1W7U9_9SPHI|nr:triose-phosphate isomerase [Candidatus Sphingobacterium stercoripullorum]HLR49337.1 triose-phosphate isomerase [Candidatus Sphingobacterium stercoripullorum]